MLQANDQSAHCLSDPILSMIYIVVGLHLLFQHFLAKADRPQVRHLGFFLHNAVNLCSGTSFHSGASVFMDDDATVEGLSIYGYNGTASATPRSELSSHSRIMSAVSRSTSSLANPHFTPFHTSRGSNPTIFFKNCYSSDALFLCNGVARIRSCVCRSRAG